MNDIKERPIVLTAQEVNAVLAGNKTQHRVPFDFEFIENVSSIQKVADEGGITTSELVTRCYHECIYDFECPLGAIGDRLWVQEFHARREFNDPLIGTHYYADGPLTLDLRHDAGLLIKYAAENMPRWASRSLLEITDIRIERVQGISESDALASGLIVQKCQQGSQWFLNPTSNMRSNVFHRDEWIGGFASYWDSLNGKLSFNDNPWVWVIEFKVIKESNDG